MVIPPEIVVGSISVALFVLMATDPIDDEADARQFMDEVDERP